MKRLVEESNDELTRSLLRAGIEHRPPPANKRHVVLALGAGGVLGMFSSKAFAWLGTTAGKVTAAGVAVGVAAAVAARPWEAPSSATRAGAPGASQQAEQLPSLPKLPEPVEPPGAAEAEPGESPQAPALGVEQEAGARAAGSKEGAEEGEAISRSEPPRRSRAGRAAKRRARGARASRPAAAEPTSEASLAEASPSAASSTEEREASARLAAEVRLVDEMHAASRRGDEAALARAIEQHRASFPDGQLVSEVDEFAAKLEASGTR